MKPLYGTGLAGRTDDGRWEPTIKVLILSHSSDMAGAESSMLDLFDTWTKNTDVEVTFIVRKPSGKLTAEIDKRGWKYYPLYYTNWAQRNLPKNPLEIDWYAKQNKKAIAKIETIIKRVSPDIVMTNTIVAPWAAIAANRLQVPHVWFVREYGGTDHGFEFALGREKTFKDIGRLSDLVVTNSRTLAQYTESFIDKIKITTLYTPFDLKKIEKLASIKVDTPYIQADSLKLVIVGRIAPSKGQADAAEAVGILNKRGVNAELCVVGTPSDQGDADTLEQAIKKYGIENKVHCVGHHSNPLSFVAMADIGIMASGQEAFGRTTFEYMALSKPVVGAESGATPEMVTPGDNGYLYKLGDPTDIAKALQHYANNHRLIEQHGRAARQKAETMLSGQYTATALYKKIEDLLSTSPQPAFTYSTEWLNQTHPVKRFIKAYGFRGLPKLVLIKSRQMLKFLYVRYVA